MAIAVSIWERRRKVIKWIFVGLIIGVVIAFSIPKEYTSTVKIAPESQNRQPGGSIGALASMIGADISSSNDGINEKVYPEIIASTPYLCHLLGKCLWHRSAGLDG